MVDHEEIQGPGPGAELDAGTGGVDLQTAPAGRSRWTRRTRVAVASATALALALVVGSVTWTRGPGDGTTTAQASGTTEGSTTVVPTLPQTRAGGQRGGGASTVPSLGQAPGAASTAVTSPVASAAQQVGLVTIVTTLGYQDGAAAGTGIVLSADGTVLTNNHVVAGATSIEVTVESTGLTYTATVVGTDATDDVAVLHLADATGLTPATLDDDAVGVGDAVTAVGNANGGGELLAAAGTVTALGSSITTQSEAGAQGETLTGLIEIDADVVAGDSGGAVLDAEGEVVGMTTAASSGSASISGYAIPIDAALVVADQILGGVASATVTIGVPAFLGIELATGGTSAVGGVLDGTPAATAGLAAGDTVTTVDGTPVTTGDELAAALGAHAPGDTVSLTWTVAATGATRTADVTLIAGPAA